MTRTTRTDPQLVDLERQIERTREALGQTVEELAAKVDVPARAKAKARETAARLRGAETRTRTRAVQAADQARSRAGQARSRVRPPSTRSTTAGSDDATALPPAPPRPSPGLHFGRHPRGRPCLDRPPHPPTAAAAAAAATTYAVLHAVFPHRD
ncbi:DUF3618 domain-containing protein [Actinacidiphila yeochonensis]|uniref:DUF3618 domain-containing protein n=1 Tax=Actinacidiphila yeochonensis TaxID=89050 RepID=UPI00068D2C08|nr:DUF3618 domain-containing protein [Actinacidiphila yeochonensis]